MREGAVITDVANVNLSMPRSPAASSLLWQVAADVRGSHVSGYLRKATTMKL
jgi:hypothetical protein